MAERIVFHENGIVKEFAPHILAEALKLHPLVSAPGRINLCHECIITID